MEQNYKYISSQESMLRWYYKINKDVSGNVFVKKNMSDEEYINVFYLNIVLVTDIKDNLCQIEYLYWIKKNKLSKLKKAPNNEDFGTAYYVNGSTSVVPSPGYHLLSNHPENNNGYYYIFSLYDPHY